MILRRLTIDETPKMSVSIHVLGTGWQDSCSTVALLALGNYIV